MDSKCVELLQHVSKLNAQLQSRTLTSSNVEFVNTIIACFSQVWKYSKEYPEFNTSIQSDSFYDIYVDMSKIYGSAGLISQQSGADDVDMTYTCGLCDEDITLVNNDLTLSIDLHVQSPNHVAVMKDFQKLKGKSTDVASNCAKKAKLARSETELRSVNDENDKFIVNVVGDSYCTLCYVPIPRGEDAKKVHISGQTHRSHISEYAASPKSPVSLAEKTCWIIKTNGIQRCILCKTKLPSELNLVSHIEGANHENKMKELESALNLEETVPKLLVDKRFDKYNLVDSVCLIINENNTWSCLLCNVRVIYPAAHTVENAHQVRVKRQMSIARNAVIENFAFDAGIIFSTANGDRHCFLCDAKLPRKNWQNYKLHVKSCRHKHKVKLQEMKTKELLA